jgi:hypothetical protein
LLHDKAVVFFQLWETRSLLLCHAKYAVNGKQHTVWKSENIMCKQLNFSKL